MVAAFVWRVTGTGGRVVGLTYGLPLPTNSTGRYRYRLALPALGGYRTISRGHSNTSWLSLLVLGLIR